MCQMKSGIILKDRVFIPDYNSHTDMLAELGISDTRQNAERLFIRAELLPPDGDVFAPVEEWRFHVDQDILPDWYVEQVDKDRMISAVKEWAKDHIHVGVDGLRISQGSDHYIKDCKNVIVCGNASISEVYDNASISEVCGSASISKVCGSASISKVCGNASISEVKGQAFIANSPYTRWIKQDGLTISKNATFKDNIAKTIWQAGDWELKKVGE